MVRSLSWPCVTSFRKVKLSTFTNLCTLGLKYQHWMKILNGVYGLKLKNIALPLPEKDIVLGGKLVLHGTFFSLACFHANNFRSQTWGLFQMIGPCIEFTTKNRAFEKSCQVMRGESVQNLTISLGESQDRDVSERRKSSSNMQGSCTLFNTLMKMPLQS